MNELSRSTDGARKQDRYRGEGNASAKRRSCNAEAYLYGTDSLYIAAYLFSHGFWLSHAETDPWGRRRFLFRDSGDLRTRVREFQSAPKALVDARTFTRALDELIDRADRASRRVDYDA